MVRSMIEYFAGHEGYKCGYCKSPNTNYSHGLWAHTLTVSDYQDLVDRGWRRSGRYVYKPTMNITCCPMYTIRCRALEFKATKSQKKVLKHFNKSVANLNAAAPASGIIRKMSIGSSSSSMSEENIGDIRDQFLQYKEAQETMKDAVHNKEVSKVAAVAKADAPGQSTSDKEKSAVKKSNKELTNTDDKEQDVSEDESSKSDNGKEKKLEEFLNELSDEDKRKLEIKLVRTSPPSPDWLASSKESHELYVKYQTVIHDDKPEKCTFNSFSDFLVTSPLVEEYSRTSPPFGYGTFHQQYWLEGKLIAVGVIDVLPKCVSSVYFFYDPQYMNLSLGTYGALREVAFTRELNLVCPEVKYYYMGYYIHSCQKMRYKGRFRPSDLLCPETYKWFPIQDCIPKLEQSAYSRLDPDVDSVDENYPNESDINAVSLRINRRMVSLGDYTGDDLEELKEYATLVGAKAGRSLLIMKY